MTATGPGAAARAADDARDLLDALGRERRALRERSFADLEAAARDKARLVESLDGSLEAVRDALAGADPQPTAPGGAANELLDLLARCRTENLTNGAIVRSLDRATRHALELVHGVTGTSEVVYGRAGGTSRLAAARISTCA